MRHTLSTILLAGALALSATIGAAAQTILGIDGEESTSVGIYIKNLSTGKVIVDHNSQLALTPASVMKAITTASALSITGPDRRFATPVVLKGHPEGDTWCGDIVVRSCADPTVESEYFKGHLGFCDSVAAAIRREGIRKISGRIIVEQTLSNPGPIAQWEIEDVAWSYGAGLFGMNWRDNTFTLYPATGQTKPEIPGLDIELKRSASGNDLVRGVYSDRLIVFARSTTDKKWAVRTSMPDPAAVFRAELKSTLSEKGISLGEKENAAGENPKEKTVYTHRSPRFAEIMRSLMVRSDNTFAEGILRAIDPAASRKDVIKREKELWATRGINTRYTIINDGSGLTRANRLSAHFIGDVLEWMAKSPQSDTYASFFPRAGKEGTLRGFLAKSTLKGQIALKTGSVSSVQAYAGYKLDSKGKPTHVIVIIVNGFFCPRRQVREGAENLLINTFK
ncbi:MAG: D-alanyl-D-alanine carboxypeptidase [Muribaculaceae bacterium]|nr:D-alanyl-D-alanine carboxypeptidase [Muribaculaceae bacterium]